jgi:DNA-binding transcriptional MerR regulator
MQPLFTAPSHRTEPILTIGKVAEITGASRKAIRHYEAVGLLPPPFRRGNYRIYSELDIFLVHMIKHAQSFGFSLAELRELVAETVKQQKLPLKFALSFIERKRVALTQQIEALHQLDTNLAMLKTEMKRLFD